MKTIAQLQKESKQAPRYILENNGIYMADRSKTNGELFTDNVADAYWFNVGYDNELMKSRAWSLSLGVKLTVKYL